jgi:hypothetical protein
MHSCRHQLYTIQSFGVKVLEAAACVVLCGAGFRVGVYGVVSLKISEVHIAVFSKYLKVSWPVSLDLKIRKMPCLTSSCFDNV